MKYLIMLEGRNENALMNAIISKDIFLIDSDDMIDLQPLVIRKIKGRALVYINALPPAEEVTILRIGDTLREKFSIPRELKSKIVNILRICSKPELEILIIISENVYGKFKRQKVWPQPKEYCVANISFEGKKFDKSSKWIENYFLKHNIKTILGKYKRYMRANHSNSEKFLFDYIK